MGTRLRISAWLNVASVFLTAMTYYCVVPTTNVRRQSFR
jgi:hypothetical protein